MVPVDYRGMSAPFWKQQAGELPVEDALQLWPIEPAAKVAFCLPEKARGGFSYHNWVLYYPLVN